MNLTDIHLRAKQEQQTAKFANAIDYEVNKIQAARNYQPNGTDVPVPSWLLAGVEAKCDKLDIPVYQVSLGCLSTANSYSQLLDHERRR